MKARGRFGRVLSLFSKQSTLFMQQSEFILDLDLCDSINSHDQGLFIDCVVTQNNSLVIDIGTLCFKFWSLLLQIESVCLFVCLSTCLSSLSVKPIYSDEIKVGLIQYQDLQLVIFPLLLDLLAPDGKKKW